MPAPRPHTHRSESQKVDDSLPRGVLLASAWSWRLLLIGAAIAVLLFVIVQLRLIVVPVLIAILLSALLVPLRDLLVRAHLPKWIAIVLCMVITIAVIGGLVFLVGQQLRAEAGSLRHQTMASVEALRLWLTGPPFNLTDRQLDDGIRQLTDAIQADTQVLINGALSVGSTVGHVVTGLLLTLFSTLFILIDGAGIWSWVVSVFPKRARPAADGAGRSGWVTLRTFVRVQILVASIDALGIGLGAFFLGLPLAIPVAVLVFLGSFIPIVGAVVTGTLAVFIALVYKGFWFALVMLAIVLFVQQVEGHVLQPLIMGTAVKVHPLAVVLVVTAGSLLAGITGALFAVPFAAVLNAMIGFLSIRADTRGSPAYAQRGTALWQVVPAERVRASAKRKLTE
ncbi:AI-2E family transporter [Gryllotalpicola protaetiae]|uniref:AI-2E family transporter n=1 Tax=Gryllotalpicola protaetiae TaxID=2419771 RepID=A0A387BW46_9MICO|nr:AI-2E family transporter [Gryllotalpicola protaetiae]AYG02601.1 AI-2E family transporter [Gryllotalpicola protaetiae]